MKFRSDRCLGCDSPRRGSFAPHASFSEYFTYDRLNEDGSIKDTDWWFCSRECYEQELNKLIPRRFAFGKTPFDDSDYIKAHNALQQEYEKNRGNSFFDSLLSKYGFMSEDKFMKPRTDKLMQTWIHAQCKAVADAEQDLNARIYADWDDQIRKQSDRVLAEEEREQLNAIKEEARNRDRAESEKRRQEEAEKNRLHRQQLAQEREKAAERRDEERRREREEKERARQEEEERKRWEKEEAARAEEEKWRPRRFDI